MRLNRHHYPLLLFEKKLHISAFVIVTSLWRNPKTTSAITTTAKPISKDQMLEAIWKVGKEKQQYPSNILDLQTKNNKSKRGAH